MASPLGQMVMLVVMSAANAYPFYAWHVPPDAAPEWPDQLQLLPDKNTDTTQKAGSNQVAQAFGQARMAAGSLRVLCVHNPLQA